jgi:hypothetical protein
MHSLHSPVGNFVIFPILLSAGRVVCHWIEAHEISKFIRTPLHTNVCYVSIVRMFDSANDDLQEKSLYADAVWLAATLVWPVWRHLHTWPVARQCFFLLSSSCHILVLTLWKGSEKCNSLKLRSIFNRGHYSKYNSCEGMSNRWVARWAVVSLNVLFFFYFTL